MKYILLMKFPLETWGKTNIGTWSPADVQKNVRFRQRLNEELTEAGELVAAQGLTGPELAKVVRARADGSPAVTDGPYPESKEFLAGYYIVDVEKPERAYEIAARISSMPGPTGGPSNLPIEVRELMTARSDM